MQDYCRKIGISGGTFDPIHNGHLIIADEIREKFNLDKVVFIPSGMPPHKNGLTVTEALHRYNMVNIALKENSHFEASPIEIERTGYTYTIDTLLQLKEIYGNSAKLYFITGADVIFDLMSWKEYQKVFTMCEFIAALRPGYNKSDFLKEIEYLKSMYKAKIHVADVPLIEISSTSIRERVRNNKSIKYLVPEGVREYIVENRLYSEDMLKNDNR